MVSAAWKSSGKTTVSLGILRHFAGRGMISASFKKGPDFIDPMWHRMASGKECGNLDTWMAGRDRTRDMFVEACTRAGEGLVLIEGNHGLHDGLSIDGSDSSAGLANLLAAPVLLVVDSRRVNRGVAAQVLGLQAMPPSVHIAGVVLNHVSSPRQEAKLRQSIETFCNAPVLGAIPSDDLLRLPERHLGLTTVDEAENAEAFIEASAAMVAKSCDLEAIRSLFYLASPMEAVTATRDGRRTEPVVRIGVFRDASFCFYYPDNLRALRECGAELLFIDSFTSDSLPEIDGLYIGGGFPESFFERLSSNQALLSSVKKAIDDGLPAWAECGGLIYLCRSATYEGRTWPLAGVLPYDIVYQRRPVGCGYMELASEADTPWFGKGESVRAHEFHYSRPQVAAADLRYQFDVARGSGIDGRKDGVVHRNLFASYAHFHAGASPDWAGRFVSLASGYRDTGRSS
jgi:cobyrinic acid a,c-diamide synthase